MRTKFVLFAVLFCISLANAQTKTKYTYAAQKHLIPAELGRVYLGMPFRDFARNIDFKESEADDSFGWLEIKVPLKKGNAERMLFKVHGLSEAEKKGLLRDEIVIGDKGTPDQYEMPVKRINTSKITAKGIVYEIIIKYDEAFDLKNFVLTKYGKPSAKTNKGIADLEWTKKTSDGLVWIIRYHEGTNSLQLIGVISKTEWDPLA